MTFFPKKYLPVISTLLTFPVAVLAQQQPYKFLEVGLFGTGSEINLANPNDFETFIRSAYTLFLTICIITAVIMIVIHGLEYMLTNIPSSKVTSKNRMRSAILGLIIALTAWLFLNTLNPKLVNLNLNLGQIVTNNSDTVVGTGGGGGGQGDPGTDSEGNNPPAPPGCDDCVSLTDYGLTCKDPSSCSLNTATAEKLGTLNQLNSNDGINWRVTEGYPPTINTHKNPCHYNATCIDAGLTSEKTGSNIQKFYDNAVSAGLRPVYEVTSSAREAELKSQGYTGTIKVISHATGEHFSVYNN